MKRDGDWYVMYYKTLSLMHNCSAYGQELSLVQLVILLNQLNVVPDNLSYKLTIETINKYVDRNRCSR